MPMAAIYARVSSEQQREAHTIASQTAALIESAKTLDLDVPKAWIFEDEGYSGATLERPGLERVRDLAAEGQIQVVLVYNPDRLSRKYAYQILGPSCNRSLIRLASERPTCSWRRRSRHFSPDCGWPPTRSTSSNGNASCAWSSRRCWLAMIRSCSGTASLCHRDRRTRVTLRRRVSPLWHETEVTFCVRGVISPLMANIYMHRFIKAFRKYGLDRRYGAVLVTYADDFVVLCRHGAGEVLDTTRRWMTSIGLALNDTKTRVCNARCESFDFLGYTFGPMYSPRTGGRYNGARPSKKAIASIRVEEYQC